MSPMLQTNEPGKGGADIHSPDWFLTFKKLSKLQICGNQGKTFHMNVRVKHPNRS